MIAPLSINSIARRLRSFFFLMSRGASLQGMVMAEWFRRWVSRPDVEYALDGEFWNAGAQVRTSRNLDEWDLVPWLRESVGPYSVGNRATFQETFDVIERELWDAFRLRRQKGLKFDLTKVFQSIGL